MATSRLERIGTIYSRVEGLLKSKAMRPEDRPIWWDIYRAFPPTRDPLYARPIPSDKIKPIFYEEDVIRAKFHKSGQPIGTVNFSDTKSKSNAQQFVEIYNNLSTSSADKSSDDLYLEALEKFKSTVEIKREQWLEKSSREPEAKNTFSSTFTEAKQEKNTTNLKNIFDN